MWKTAELEDLKEGMLYRWKHVDDNYRKFSTPVFIPKVVKTQLKGINTTIFFDVTVVYELWGKLVSSYKYYNNRDSEFIFEYYEI